MTSPSESKTVEVERKDMQTDAEQMQQLREWMGGEGEQIPLATLHTLWEQFSAAFAASWLIDSDNMRGNFCAWLINRRSLSSPESAAVAWQLLNAKGEIIGQSHEEDEVKRRLAHLNSINIKSDVQPFWSRPLFAAPPVVGAEVEQALREHRLGPSTDEAGVALDHVYCASCGIEWPCPTIELASAFASRPAQVWGAEIDKAFALVVANAEAGADVTRTLDADLQNAIATLRASLSQTEESR